MATDSIQYAMLPLVSVLPKRKMIRATELLEELNSHEYVLDDEGREIKRSARVDQIKEELQELQGDQPGLRFSDRCFVARVKSGRRTLDKGLLMENGVAADVIERSMKQGEDYVERTFRRIAT